MKQSIAQLFAKLSIDLWRQQSPFSNEVEEANKMLFQPNVSSSEMQAILNKWFSNHQPCLFGRMAAKANLLRFCILTEDDLAGSDEEIRKKIQCARLEWSHEGFLGAKSGFIVFVRSERIARALPDANMKELALRLASLYLLEEVEADQVHMDALYLEKPGQQKTTWRWNVGANYFSAQGDGRWWHDHRIPGGMAFSMNSVGHLVKSGKMVQIMKLLEQELEAPPEGWEAAKVDSLEKALELAMRTIAKASNASSGKATELLPLPGDRSQMPVATCPYSIPKDLSDKNFCEYQGFYHTDFTVPSEYFVPDVLRPDHVKALRLDFTYPFHDSIENPDFHTTGMGQKVRNVEDDIDVGLFNEDLDEREKTGSRMKAVEVSRSSYEQALKVIEEKSR